MTRAELGWAYASLGLFQRGVELARLAHASAAKERLPYMRMHPLVVLARVHIRLGDLAEAGAALQQGYGELRPEGIQGFEMILLPLADGELAIARQEYARAVTVIDDLMTYLDNTHTRLFRYEALYLKGKALRALGRIDEAREVWMSARAHAEDLEARRVLWPILTALSEIEARLGNHVEADALRQQARMIVEYIADHAGMPDRRASFMNLPDVRAVLPGG
jgi:tetratricopeptide (TPR) repeat protein